MSGRRPRQVRRLVVAATAVVVMAACDTGGDDLRDPPAAGAVGTSAAEPPPPIPEAQQEEPVRIELTIGERRATVTLADNAAARDLASMLPITVPMGDLFGREKPGPLPRPLATADVEPVDTYRVGQLAYWPPNADIFVVYAGDGLPVPDPGLIPLGTVDTGLDLIAGAGDDFDLSFTALTTD